MIYLYLAIAFVVGYFLGNINFARIFSWRFARKDITKVGSKNPGTMNMLRTRGFGEAMLTLLFEALKVGLPALGCYFLFNHYFEGYGDLAYFLSAFAGILGHCFPVFYHFKGGKGVACTFGMFVFSPHFWLISLIMFVICFVLFMFIEFPFIISFIFIFTMAVYGTCIFAIETPMLYIVLIVILWLNFAFIVYLHRGNIKRFIAGTENKVNFKEKVFGRKKKAEKEVAPEENAAPASAQEESAIEVEEEPNAEEAEETKPSKKRVRK